MRTLLALIGLLSLVPSIARADITVPQWIAASESERQVMLIYLAGVEHGLSTANIALVDEGRAALYCPPPRLPLTAEQVGAIVDHFLEAHPSLGDSVSLPIVTLFALQDTFPC